MLRAAQPSDLEFIHSLYMHPTINPFLLYEVMGLEEFRPIYSDLLKDGVKYVFEYEGKQAGMCKLRPYTYRASHIVYLGGVAIAPEFMGKGLGKQLMQGIIAHAASAGFKRIELSVAVTNKTALTLYEKSGFRQEGILKNFTWLAAEQKFLDEIMMAYLF